MNNGKFSHQLEKILSTRLIYITTFLLKLHIASRTTKNATPQRMLAPHPASLGLGLQRFARVCKNVESYLRCPVACSAEVFLRRLKCFPLLCSHLDGADASPMLGHGSRTPPQNSFGQDKFFCTRNCSVRWMALKQQAKECRSKSGLTLYARVMPWNRTTPHLITYTVKGMRILCNKIICFL